jgi:Protein of unknown function (DUF3618)
MSVTVRPTYGWHGDGKSAAEIAGDIRQTRYRLESDVRALRAKLVPRRLMPFAALVMALVPFLIRHWRRSRARR